TRKPPASRILKPIRIRIALISFFDESVTQKYPTAVWAGMMAIKPKHDNRQYCFIFFALNQVNKAASPMRVRLLAGIKIAATSGESLACTANDNPTKL